MFQPIHALTYSCSNPNRPTMRMNARELAISEQQFLADLIPILKKI